MLTQLDRLDHRFTGMPETAYVFEARKHRLRIAVVVLLTLVSLLTVAKTSAGWLLVAFAVGIGATTLYVQRTTRANPDAVAGGRWHDRG